MKICSDETLLLGGLYCVFEIILALLGLEVLRDIVFLVFLISVIMLCFNKTPKYISYTLNKYPKTSYYLMSFGWIPYFTVICFVLFLAYIQLFDSVDNLPLYIKYIIPCSIAVLIMGFISLIIAYIKVKIKAPKDKGV